jgi:glycosyltransferase involved in cell wall biosynthesis
MKISLTMNLPYFPGHGGANNSNRLMLQSLAARGHAVSVVVPAFGIPPLFTPQTLASELAKEGASLDDDGDAYRFRLKGVDVHAVKDPVRLRRYLAAHMQSSVPDVVIVSTEDPSQNLLAAALDTGVPVVYMARTTSFLPFGPQAYFPSEERSKLLERVRVIVTVSDFVAAYIKEWSGLHAVALPISFFGDGPFPDFGRFDSGFVTMINPCVVKGLPIFLELASAFPEVSFAAVPTWGTTPEDRSALEALSNVTVLAAERDVDRIYEKTRILLVPSLWAEAKARVVLEGMLRGIPVLTSNVGGMAEVKLGTEFVLPVQAIEQFTTRLDGNMLPEAVIPPQDIAPWREALTTLLSDRRRYESHARIAKEKALQYVGKISTAPLEELLAAPEDRAARNVAPGKLNIPKAAEMPASASLERFKVLSSAQQALLMRRLKQKTVSPEDKDSD